MIRQVENVRAGIQCESHFGQDRNNDISRSVHTWISNLVYAELDILGFILIENMVQLQK